LPVTAADFTAVLKTLNANGGQCLPVADLALGATKALGSAPPTAQAVWLATMTQESAYFRTTEEYAKTGPYAPYIGRTFEQVTWGANYRAFGAWCAAKGYIATPDLFVQQPKLLAETQWAWLGGVWFFGAKGLWSYADKGDFQTVQVRVNGASPFPSGWLSRLAAYRAWTNRLVKPAPLKITRRMDEPTAKRLQQWVGVEMDGDVGRVTWAAVQRWLDRTPDGTMSRDDVEVLQDRIGAYVDGDFGPGSIADLQAFLNANGV
jgi:predicted chitinase